jgi:hypothetical protein
MVLKTLLNLPFCTVHNGTLYYTVDLFTNTEKGFIILRSILYRRGIEKIGLLSSIEDNPRIVEPVCKVASIAFFAFLSLGMH